MNENKPLPKGWEVKKLGEVCEVEYGTRVVRKRDGGTIFPVYGGGGATFFMDTFNREDCLVVARFAMSEKCTRFVKGKLFLNDSGLSVKTKNDKEINQEFLNLQFLHLNDYIYSLARGAAQKNLNVPIFRKLEIHYPRSLKAQKRIVAILDKTFAEITKAETIATTNLQNAKELFESYLQGVLSDKRWTIVKLNNVCEKVEYGSSSKSLAVGELPVLRMGNIQDGRLAWDDLKFSNNKEDNKKYILKHNDVLFNRTNSPEWVGKTAIYKSEMPAIFAGYLIRIHRKKDLLNADYLNYYLNSQMARNYGNTVIISSVNQANINGTKLKKYPIPLPTLKKQKEIVQKLEQLQSQVKKLEIIYQQKIIDLSELKKSILQKAFNGEL
ncbi:Type I restriction-modification system, specificity subunit S [uncultured Gammaproteobacteria bacterium]|nr:Type I restriction-modification system, specificity subunit S [uncultured Gammaproteobacteria bacterium]CAC9626470.1 Type I restriction-modification system, specificity subunit S [uncultured Gammaproteobacteria bacterium]